MTDDGRLILSSEAGVLFEENAHIRRRWKLKSGDVLMADLKSGRLLESEALKTHFASLRPYGEWVKNIVHLDDLPAAPAPDGEGDTQTLLRAFIASASAAPRPTVQEWTEQWHSIITIIDSMGLNLPCYEQDKQEIEDVLSQGKYAISHSPEYREAYRPHYRIVKREVFEQCILPLLPIP